MRNQRLYLLAAFVVACLLILPGCDKGDTVTGPTVANNGVPVATADCEMLRVKVRTYFGPNGGAEVARWAVDSEPEIRAEPLNTKGNPLAQTCGWNGSATFELLTPGMECSMIGDPESASRFLKCDKRGKGRVAGRVLVGGVTYSGSWDFEVI